MNPRDGETKAASCDDSVLLTKSQDLRLYSILDSPSRICIAICRRTMGPSTPETICDSKRPLSGVKKLKKRNWNLKRSCLCCPGKGTCVTQLWMGVSQETSLGRPKCCSPGHFEDLPLVTMDIFSQNSMVLSYGHAGPAETQELQL